MLLDTFVSRLGCELIKNTQMKNMREFTANARNLGHVDCIVIDVSAFEENDDNEITEGIVALRNICDARIVVIAFDKDMEFVNNLKDNSIQNILYGENDIFERLESMIVNDEVIEIKPVDDEHVIRNVMREDKENEKIRQPPVINNIFNSVKRTTPQTRKKHSIPKRDMSTIAICSSKSGIGCTHHAIGLVKYLTEQGYKACYVEANNKNITVDLSLDRRMSAYNNYYKYDGRIIMYPMGSSMKEIVERKYQFIVFDYGEDTQIPMREFWSKDLQVHVVGNKAWELEKFHINLKNGDYINCPIIMNFTPKIYREDIKNSYVECKQLFFAEFSPDVFFDNDNDEIYAELVSGLFTAND